jgi:signal peptidase II
VGVAHGAQVDRRRALRLFLLVALAVVLLDQVTKHLSVIWLEDHEPVRLLFGAVYLTLVRNSGAAFSMGTDYTFVFPVITLCVIVGLAFVMRGVRSRPWAVALGLVLGGALGNLGDRVFRSPGPFLGHVVDMISVFDDRGQVFPVFNAADSALTIGVVLIALLELTGRRRDGTRVTGRSRPDPDGAEATDRGTQEVRD